MPLHLDMIIDPSTALPPLGINMGLDGQRFQPKFRTFLLKSVEIAAFWPVKR